jgi:hypothetical protein
MNKQDKKEQELAEKDAASQSKDGTKRYVVHAYDTDNKRYVYIVTVVAIDFEPHSTVAAYLDGVKLKDGTW